MSQIDFYPYEFAAGALTLNATIQGVETERTASGALLFLDDLPPEASLRLDLRVRIAPGTVERVTAAENRGEPEPMVAVILRSIPSRLRRLVQVDDDGSDTFSAHVDFRRSELHQNLVATPVLYRTTGGPETPGYASHAGALIGDGEPLQIFLEEPPTPPGGHLDIEFEDFRTSGDQLRRSAPDALLALDIQGDLPKLWLNSGIPNLVEIASTRARRGANARIRDALFQAVTAQVWTSLILASASALNSALRDGVEGRAALDELVEWQKRVLHFWGPRIYHWFGDRDQAIDEICRVAATESGLAELNEFAVPAIQQYSGSRTAFDGLIRLVTREGV
jgi:hypothetical protein